MNNLLLIIGGIINLFLGIFHLSFWKVFNWPETIASLDFMNLAIIQVLNLHTAFIIFVFAGLSLFCRNELLGSRIGRLVTGTIMVFYLLRAVNQMIFWGTGHPLSWALTAGFVAIGVLYLVPLASAIRGTAVQKPETSGVPA